MTVHRGSFKNLRLIYYSVHTMRLKILFSKNIIGNDFSGNPNLLKQIRNNDINLLKQIIVEIANKSITTTYGSRRHRGVQRCKARVRRKYLYGSVGRQWHCRSWWMYSNSVFHATYGCKYRLRIFVFRWHLYGWRNESEKINFPTFSKCSNTAAIPDVDIRTLYFRGTRIGGDLIEF